MDWTKIVLVCCGLIINVHGIVGQMGGDDAGAKLPVANTLLGGGNIVNTALSGTQALLGGGQIAGAASQGLDIFKKLKDTVVSGANEFLDGNNGLTGLVNLDPSFLTGGGPPDLFGLGMLSTKDTDNVGTDDSVGILGDSFHDSAGKVVDTFLDIRDSDLLGGGASNILDIGNLSRWRDVLKALDNVIDANIGVLGNAAKSNGGIGTINEEAMNAIREGMADLPDAINGLSGAFQDGVGVYNDLRGENKTGFGGVVNSVLGGMAKSMIPGPGGLNGNASGSMTDVMNMGMNIGKDALNGMGINIGDFSAIKPINDLISGGIGGFGTVFGNKDTETDDGIGDAFGKVLDTAKDGRDKVLDTAKDGQDKVLDVLNPEDGGGVDTVSAIAQSQRQLITDAFNTAVDTVHDGIGNVLGDDKKDGNVKDDRNNVRRGFENPFDIDIMFGRPTTEAGRSSPPSTHVNRQGTVGVNIPNHFNWYPNRFRVAQQEDDDRRPRTQPPRQQRTFNPAMHNNRRRMNGGNTRMSFRPREDHGEHNDRYGGRLVDRFDDRFTQGRGFQGRDTFGSRPLSERQRQGNQGTVQGRDTFGSRPLSERQRQGYQGTVQGRDTLDSRTLGERQRQGNQGTVQGRDTLGSRTLGERQRQGYQGTVQGRDTLGSRTLGERQRQGNQGTVQGRDTLDSRTLGERQRQVYQGTVQGRDTLGSRTLGERQRQGYQGTVQGRDTLGSRRQRQGNQETVQGRDTLGSRRQRQGNQGTVQGRDTLGSRTLGERQRQGYQGTVQGRDTLGSRTLGERQRQGNQGTERSRGNRRPTVDPRTESSMRGFIRPRWSRRPQYIPRQNSIEPGTRLRGPPGSNRGTPGAPPALVRRPFLPPGDLSMMNGDFQEGAFSRGRHFHPPFAPFR